MDADDHLTIPQPGRTDTVSTMSTTTPTGSAPGGSGSSRRRILLGSELESVADLPSTSDDSDLD